MNSVFFVRAHFKSHLFQHLYSDTHGAAGVTDVYHLFELMCLQGYVHCDHHVYELHESPRLQVGVVDSPTGFL